MLKYAGLAAKFGSLKTDDINAGHVSEIAGVLDIEASEETIQKIVDLAKSQNPTESALSWAMQLWESGELTQILNPDESQDHSGYMLVRCPHCMKPFEVNLSNP